MVWVTEGCRDLLFPCEVLRGHGHPPSKVGDAGGTHSSKDSL